MSVEEIVLRDKTNRFYRVDIRSAPRDRDSGRGEGERNALKERTSAGTWVRLHVQFEMVVIRRAAVAPERSTETNR